MDDSLQVHEIAWSDAWHDPAESDPDSWPEKWIVHTVGFLVREDPDVLHLAGEILQDGQYRSVTHIPKVLIVSRKAVGQTVKEVD